MGGNSPARFSHRTSFIDDSTLCDKMSYIQIMNIRTTDFASLLWTAGSRIAYRENHAAILYFDV